MEDRQFHRHDVAEKLSVRLLPSCLHQELLLLHQIVDTSRYISHISLFVFLICVVRSSLLHICI